MPGNWTANNATLVVGYNYLMEVDFPRMFVNSDPVKVVLLTQLQALPFIVAR